jgi:hypothetical protein
MQERISTDDLQARLGLLEWAACQSLGRRLHGRVSADEREPGRPAVVVEFPANPH